jgi:hypothetical protein
MVRCQTRAPAFGFGWSGFVAARFASIKASDARHAWWAAANAGPVSSCENVSSARKLQPHGHSHVRYKARASSSARSRSVYRASRTVTACTTRPPGS